MTSLAACSLQVLSPLERLGGATGPRARLHPGRGSAGRGLGRAFEPGLPTRSFVGAASRLLLGARPPAADHRLRRQVRQELEGREPRVRQIRRYVLLVQPSPSYTSGQ